MKNLLLLLLLNLTIICNSQVATITSDSNNVETSSFYNERGQIRITFFETKIQLDIQLQGEEYNSLRLNYELLGLPVLLYNENSQQYNILFDIISKGKDKPIGGLIDPSTNSIMLFYDDGSTLLYIGEGIKIII